MKARPPITGTSPGGGEGAPACLQSPGWSATDSPSGRAASTASTSLWIATSAERRSSGDCSCQNCKSQRSASAKSLARCDFSRDLRNADRSSRLIVRPVSAVARPDSRRRRPGVPSSFLGVELGERQPARTPTTGFQTAPAGAPVAAFRIAYSATASGRQKVAPPASRKSRAAVRSGTFSASSTSCRRASGPRRPCRSAPAAAAHR